MSLLYFVRNLALWILPWEGEIRVPIPAIPRDPGFLPTGNLCILMGFYLIAPLQVGAL
jgi:hypothetical protein